MTLVSWRKSSHTTRAGHHRHWLRGKRGPSRWIPTVTTKSSRCLTSRWSGLGTLAGCFLSKYRGFPTFPPMC